MQTFPSRPLSDSDAVQLYEWLERSPAAVLKCTCRDVQRLKLISSVSHAIGGQNIFLHHETPGLMAEVCGIIVGVIPKEEHITYQFDDGTAVLRLIETRKSLRQAVSPHQPSISGSTAPGGVPECYIMPPQPKASSSANRLDSATAFSGLAPLVPRFEVADIVKCTGKIQLDRSGERCLLVRGMHLCQNPNQESLHHIEVIKLEHELYRRPFDWDRVQAVEPIPAQAPTRAITNVNLSARLLVADIAPDAKAVTDHLLSTEAKAPKFADERLSRDEARRLLSSGHVSSSPSDAFSPARRARSARAERPSHTSSAGSRKLRAPDKIADHNLTESYFQLQLQQHITLQYHSRPFTLPDIWADPILSSLARRLVRVRLHNREASRSSQGLRRDSKITSEQLTDKVRRLFEWAARKMMQDGFITLSDQSQHQDPALPNSKNSVSAESYHLVTPEYLLASLRKLLGKSQSAPPHADATNEVDDLTARLRILDDRFRFVNRSLVQDSLALYHSLRVPIVID